MSKFVIAAALGLGLLSAAGGAAQAHGYGPHGHGPHGYSQAHRPHDAPHHQRYVPPPPPRHHYGWHAPAHRPYRQYGWR